MTIDVDALAKLLCESLCEDVKLQRRPDGALMLRTPFRFPDGDGYPIHVLEAPSGGVRLSDRGHTLMRVSYEHDVDSFMEGAGGRLLERIMGDADCNGPAALSASTPPLRSWSRPSSGSGRLSPRYTTCVSSTRTFAPRYATT